MNIASALLLLQTWARILSDHSGPECAVNSSNYAAHTVSAIGTLQQWYNQTSGLWDSTGWWNSANVLTMLADFNSVDQVLNTAIHEVFENTFVKAQLVNLPMLKVMTPHSIDSYYGPQLAGRFGENPFNIDTKGFLNQYYDDEGWWALAWIKVYDNTGKYKYLEAAEDIFDDMMTGWGATCGGLWWDKKHSYSGAIENELFFSVAAHLAYRSLNKNYYRHWAVTSWQWFQSSGMINERGTINNGLDLITCANDNGTVWTYNQGVIIGGLLELYRSYPDMSHILTAQSIAAAAIETLSDSDGILHEICEPDCGADGPQFKGIFMRNLQKLQEAFPCNEFKAFIDRNADSIWSKDRSIRNELGLVWSGPFREATASTQSSACDALVAAVSAE